ncbi:capsular polysaccharide transport system permease protein [Litoreibacter halocynthiae]|uniref:Capsular polysaccharide transport system permease protein n=1 Tax=Litoreibacter halocynthiae TaxID=1242689 RepID=A0A4R7LDF5_9RHOB|nr:sugar transporter [Litoreibacter halocynthiae]TDT73139.1 capsular polysaccharide transport system permease protein [Litoreibacter halocynthiae]
MSQAQSGNLPYTAVELARIKTRHLWLIISFVLFFLLPVLTTGVYLFAIAKDQYASTVAFTVRTEDVSSAVDILGGISNLSGASSSDSDILYEFIQSQQLVKALDDKLDLRNRYSRSYSEDFYFSLKPGGTIEDLTKYWERMVKIYYDSGSGLIELRVKAFDPNEALEIANAIVTDSTEMINELNAIAREDATRYAKEDLDLAVDRLKLARQSILEFRARTQIVDPQADLQGQMGILNNLQQQFATALIELDLLRETTRDNDPRIVQAENRIKVIQERITEERLKFGSSTIEGGEDYVTIIGEFERLNVDLEFAQSTYLAALASYDSSIAEAQRKSRYLAAYLKPSAAERSLYPERSLLLLMVAVFAFLLWTILSLAYYSIRDRG